MWTHVACVTNEIRCQVDRSKLTMDKVEFLFKCVEEGKLSKEQASAILGKSQPGQAKSTDKGAASTTGALKRPLEHSKREDLLLKYKELQKDERSTSIKKQKRGGSCRNPVLLKITLGGMRFDEVKQRGCHCKELGPNVAVSVEPSASYNDLIEEGKKLFFPRKSHGELKISFEYFLADAQGSKLPNDIKGRSWSLNDYLHVHGYYPSKTKIFCVQREHLLDLPTSPSLFANPTMAREFRSEIPSLPQVQVNDSSKATEISQSRPVGSVARQARRTEDVGVVSRTVSHGEKELDKYEVPMENIHLGKKIGQGGFGSVHLSELNGTVVAVKRVPIYAGIDMGEIQTLSTLRHPNILVFMGYAKDKQNVYIITNYVHGGDLYDLLFKQKKQLTAADQFSISDQAAQALAYMHCLNPPLIHRDIKPMNILVEVGTLHVYLSDMGLARLKTSASTMTQVGNAIGTPYYCAPESYKGNVCVASDIWSFGLVLSELFGRRHAWGRLLSLMEMSGLILSQTLPPLDHLKAPIRRLCQMCLDYDPRKRIDILNVIEKLRECEKIFVK